MTGPYVLGLDEVDRTQAVVVGGKGASLGELSRVDGVRVPAGFCVTTAAFRRTVARTPQVGDLIDRLFHLDPADGEAVRALSARLRAAVAGAFVPDDVVAAIIDAHARLGADGAYAVRSSATAEDSPTASFAGQHDTHLDVVGPDAILGAVRRCWVSLFTDRAVAYRRRNGIDHRSVQMAVVVQRMVPADAAGVLFTADPVTGDRRVATVEAVFGLGEALVDGRVDADVFRVRDGTVTGTPAAGRRAATARPAAATGGPQVEGVRPDPQTLTDEQVVGLVRLGRRIEARLGRPQDIEWCRVDEDLHVVQSRPITTLFPVPATDDEAYHVYVSVGHQQMMTDPMKPLGLSLWRLTAMAPMQEAGGRLFVDVTGHLAVASSRTRLLEVVGRSDPLIADALRTVLDRGDVVAPSPDETTAGRQPVGGPGGRPPVGGAGGRPPVGGAGGRPPVGGGVPVEVGAEVVPELIRRNEESVAALRREIRTRQGPKLFDFLLEAFEEHRRVLGDPVSMQAIMAGMEATWWLDDRLGEWLGERNAADTLTLSAPGNVTSEMGLALLDVADVIRPHPEVVAYLERVEDEDFLPELPGLPGGTEARAAVEAFLDRYGMRCVGEIDVTRPRWSERPATLLPLILDNVRNFEPGAAGRRFEQGRRTAEAKAREVVERLRALPDGERRADEAARMIDRVRAFVGYREYPKYGIVSRYLLYRQALLAEADRLVRAGVLAEREDAFFLTFEEFRDAVGTHRVDPALIRSRREDFRWYLSLTPPRVLTSHGESISGSYRRTDVPAGALVGLSVSAGTVEGRARVVLDLARAALAPGDILVTPYTDPSWTPVFVTVAGLVTEVGGLMTHGAVIAREYGLPAVVGVEGATRRIRDGQRIRLHACDGYVELLD
ncbi:rifamycin-inactivating phosphotransferase [Micromonospora sp. NPDC000207]|uniref:rifamycin-inactivating phosphotransferase n=1 Tax=Micromonospora sp. NPDC000207 TaxID=3154246 RepID=UPI0033241675